jgi:hypothetical protein
MLGQASQNICDELKTTVACRVSLGLIHDKPKPVHGSNQVSQYIVDVCKFWWLQAQYDRRDPGTGGAPRLGWGGWMPYTQVKRFNSSWTWLTQPILLK